MRCSRSEAPSLHRRCPASPVLRASPPPWTARPDPRGLSVGVCHATARASRVASIPLFHACCRHYPGGTGRCLRRSLPDPCQPSSSTGRVGFRIKSFEACSAFARATARMVAGPPKATLVIEVLRPMSSPPSSAPTATGWSDSCRAGFAPAEEWRLCTAHQLSQVSDPATAGGLGLPDPVFRQPGPVRAKRGRPLGRRGRRLPESVWSSPRRGSPTAPAREPAPGSGDRPARRRVPRR